MELAIIFAKVFGVIALVVAILVLAVIGTIMLRDAEYESEDEDWG